MKKWIDTSRVLSVPCKQPPMSNKQMKWTKRCFASKCPVIHSVPDPSSKTKHGMFYDHFRLLCTRAKHMIRPRLVFCWQKVNFDASVPIERYLQSSLHHCPLNIIMMMITHDVVLYVYHKYRRTQAVKVYFLSKGLSCKLARADVAWSTIDICDCGWSWWFWWIIEESLKTLSCFSLVYFIFIFENMFDLFVYGFV